MRTNDGTPIKYYSEIGKSAKVEFGFFRIHGKRVKILHEYRYLLVIGDWFVVEADPRYQEEYLLEDGTWHTKNTIPMHPWLK